ncbi:MAG: ComEA family DNA-binding protein [Oscillospiraceae bacterium]|jgi:competence protein ComEA|nr:ComEA family DNA-binding protein [Oscillospiraceae bacterium]
MKLSRWEGAILVLSALFLAFTAGWFLRGSSSSQPLRVETQRRLEVTVTALPAPTPEAPRERVDINTADAEALKELPGIGEKRAADIIADREKNGPYRFPEELTRVKGIGEETLAELLDYITTGEETQ